VQVIVLVGDGRNGHDEERYHMNQEEKQEYPISKCSFRRESFSLKVFDKQFKV